MKTIVEPKEHIEKLWGKQRIHEDAVYRQMRYVLRVDHDGKVLLHNVVTGQLVVLSEDEAETLQKLPAEYSPKMEQLVAEHYLVPEDYDEHQQVVNLRNILWRIVDAHTPEHVTSYLILPTTACNARCWYCFEKGIKPATMTEETANDVVDFIEKHCGGKPVHIWWFGGEPTLAANRIDQISEGLRRKGIQYSSIISTNGYEMDEDMIDRAKNLWNLRQATISLDGTEETYNRVKAFPNAQANPYQRMMRNAEMLLKKDIAVALRMNYDQHTYKEFADLLQEAKTRFPKGTPLMVYPHQIFEDYPEEDSDTIKTLFSNMNAELSNMACIAGLYRPKTGNLPCLTYMMCGAANGRWFVIRPDGKLCCCGEQLGDNQIKGDLIYGVTNEAIVREWKQFADKEMCRDCKLFPYCVKLIHCKAVNRCFGKKEIIMQTIELANCHYDSWMI
jgi:radical SAM protein with 4Fe4S-binding SPASM domain